jgi:transcription antitermination factor NusG
MPSCYTGVEMAKKRPVDLVISKATQEDAKRTVSEAVRVVSEILARVNAEAEEFRERRARLRERVESGGRKTSGRIV